VAITQALQFGASAIVATMQKTKEVTAQKLLSLFKETLVNKTISTEKGASQ
jgi:hypothetical protein